MHIGWFKTRLFKAGSALCWRLPLVILNRFPMVPIAQHVPLRSYNTFGIDVQARYFASCQSVEEVGDVLANPALQNVPLLVLGGGSNVLLVDSFPGLVLHNAITGIELVEESSTHYVVRAGAGENWHGLVRWCIERDMAGIENLSLIPGSVGAAPMQNIGAYGVELQEVFSELTALELRSGQSFRFSRSDCEFGYRSSVFKTRLKGQFIITSVTLQLKKKPLLNTSYGAIEQELSSNGVTKPTIRDISDAVIRIRQRKLPDPAEIGNAGSFFKNPVVSREQHTELQQAYPDVVGYPLEDGSVKLAAGWLIDKAGWKGKTCGSYGVHKNQALVLVNYGGASGKDIYALSEEIAQDIHKRFGVQLEREVNVVPA